MALRDLADRLLGKRPPDRGAELAFGGLNIVGGVVSDEHNADLKGAEATRKAVIMRRTDAQVRAVQRVVDLPIRSTPWFVEPPDKPGSAEKEAATLLQENLFGGMEQSFDDLMREACLAIYYGWRVPEIVWRQDTPGGLLSIRKVAQRNPELVNRWLFDPDGNVVGFLYVGNRPTGDGVVANGTASAKFQEIPVPLEKTLHFCYEPENGSPQGFGLWRSMYPHWYIKQALYKIISIGVERNLLGIPLGKAPLGASEDDKRIINNQLRFLRAAEDAQLMLPNGWEVEWFESSKNPMDAMPFVAHHDAKIAQAALAQFLNLGQDTGGTQALASTHAKLFMDAEEGEARWAESQLNMQLSKRWALYNYGPGLRPPVITHKPIRLSDATGMANALNTLVTGGFLTAEAEDEQYMRDFMDLPRIPIEQLKAAREEKAAAAAAVLEDANKRRQEAIGLRPDVPGQPTPQNEAKPGEPVGGAKVASEPSGLLAAGQRKAEETGFVHKAKDVLDGLRVGYLEALLPIVTEIETSKPIAKGIPLAKLNDVAVPGAGDYKAFVKDFLWSVFNKGMAVRLGEMGKAPVGEVVVSNKTRQWITAKAGLIADSHVSRLRAAVLDRVLTGVRASMSTSQIFSDAGAVAIERLSKDTSRDWNMAAAETIAVLNEEQNG